MIGCLVRMNPDTFPIRTGLSHISAVTEGSVTEAGSPKNGKYLYVDKDYVNFEFKGRVDLKEPQAHYKTDFGKVKCLEVVLTPGSVLYIPAYWFYSIEFHSGASLCKFYQTYMGSLSVIHYHTLSFYRRTIPVISWRNPSKTMRHRSLTRRHRYYQNPLLMTPLRE